MSYKSEKKNLGFLFSGQAVQIDIPSGSVERVDKIKYCFETFKKCFKKDFEKFFLTKTNI